MQVVLKFIMKVKVEGNPSNANMPYWPIILVYKADQSKKHSRIQGTNFLVKIEILNSAALNI